MVHSRASASSFWCKCLDTVSFYFSMWALRTHSPKSLSVPVFVHPKSSNDHRWVYVCCDVSSIRLPITPTHPFHRQSCHSVHSYPHFAISLPLIFLWIFICTISSVHFALCGRHLLADYLPDQSVLTLVLLFVATDTSFEKQQVWSIWEHTLSCLDQKKDNQSKWMCALKHTIIRCVYMDASQQII